MQRLKSQNTTLSTYSARLPHYLHARITQFVDLRQRASTLLILHGDEAVQRHGDALVQAHQRDAMQRIAHTCSRYALVSCLASMPDTQAAT